MSSVVRIIVGAMLAGGALAVAFYAPRARATEYEIYAERGGAAMREDEPNVRRFRDNDSEPFASLEDCRQAAIGEKRFDHTLGPGWKLQCRPLDVPTPRVVLR